jgi:anti-sigma B factor antagonist
MIKTEITANSVTLIAPKMSNLTAANANGFRQKVLELVDVGHNLLVIDLTEVSAVDSSGIGALLGLLKRIGHRGELALCGLSEGVMQSFRITRMDRVFRIHADSHRAIQAMAA